MLNDSEIPNFDKVPDEWKPAVKGLAVCSYRMGAAKSNLDNQVKHIRTVVEMLHLPLNAKALDTMRQMLTLTAENIESVAESLYPPAPDDMLPDAGT